MPFLCVNIRQFFYFSSEVDISLENNTAQITNFTSRPVANLPIFALIVPELFSVDQRQMEFKFSAKHVTNFADNLKHNPVKERFNGALPIETFLPSLANVETF